MDDPTDAGEVPAIEDPAGDEVEGVPIADDPADVDAEGVPAGDDVDGVPAADVPTAAPVGLAATDVPAVPVLTAVEAVMVELMDEAGVLGLAAEPPAPAGVEVAAGVQASSESVIMAMAILRRTGNRLFKVLFS